jgi:hypothetical protein
LSKNSCKTSRLNFKEETESQKKDAACDLRVGIEKVERKTKIQKNENFIEHLKMEIINE